MEEINHKPPTTTTTVNTQATHNPENSNNLCQTNMGSTMQAMAEEVAAAAAATGVYSSSSDSVVLKKTQNPSMAASGSRSRSRRTISSSNKRRLDKVIEQQQEENGEQEKQLQEFETTREKFMRYRSQVAGKVLVPETWGYEGRLNEWSDPKFFFHRSPPATALVSAKSALIQDCRSISMSCLADLTSTAATPSTASASI